MRVLPYGTGAVLVELASLAEVLGLDADVRASPPPGLIETVPAARTLLVRFDPAATDVDAVARDLAARTVRPVPAPDGPLVRVPVSYDGEDLAFVADHLGMTSAAVIAAHLAGEYTVAFLGMAPGFYFLSGGDPRLVVPRRASPRASVPAGAVGLAGEFTGIYPRTGPGGWQLIGRTAAPLWHLDRHPAAALAPGTRVRLVAR